MVTQSFQANADWPVRPKCRLATVTGTFGASTGVPGVLPGGGDMIVDRRRATQRSK